MTKLKKNSSNRQGLNFFTAGTGPQSGQKKTFHEKLKFASRKLFSDINWDFPKHLHKIFKSLLLHKVMKPKQVDFN